MTDLTNWTPREKPQRIILDGQYVRLEPLDVDRHGDQLYVVSSVADVDQRFRYLFDEPPASREDFTPWLEKSAASTTTMFFAVIDKKTGLVAGRQALMRIEPQYGVIEIGNVYWGPAISRQRGATEAQYLFMQYVFDGLGYRRYEWKCNNDNEPSKRAALRFGFTFEGIFRQHMVAKGLNRDSAWFSIIDSEWPALKRAYQAWLSSDNFNENGEQIRKLESFIKAEQSA
ncbi:RimJ/RimL family protein N-acetyltransferase [Paenochrobactrum gallinarii]|uniref:RimJ/RimL family protein N-acetyltransferase n=1 Tax=Paenochrobactrum gallinarii TaxID=643673 RepID=A0A841LXB3_9HYPH|nr:GNAT family protein [Paenochrobactrum gallinarii]MBB6261500.1 RimJ/RimL family protein N-acetyltransferase [Paenochrobactrum gallinarii]